MSPTASFELCDLWYCQLVLLLKSWVHITVSMMNLAGHMVQVQRLRLLYDHMYGEPPANTMYVHTTLHVK